MSVAFGPFRLDRGRRLLLDGDSPVHLAPKAFDLLGILIDSRPTALPKDQLITAVWPQTVVEESNLAGLIADIRAALHDDAREPRYIRTVHGFGYAFCGEIVEAVSPRRAGSIAFKGEEHDLHEGDNILGRDPAADIVVEDSTVSRRHACISIAEGCMTIDDLSSKNGTFLDGQKVTCRMPLVPGQSIVLGDARLTLRIGAAAGTTITLSGSRSR